MKYTGRLFLVGIFIVATMTLKIMHFINHQEVQGITASFFFHTTIMWLIGLQFDKARYYQKQTKEKAEQLKNSSEKMISELELAKKIQQSALSSDLIDEKIEIKGKYLPSAELSGDMYAWYKIDKNRYGVILLDVVGHGVASSLVNMSILSLLKGLITKAVEPEKVMNQLNSHMEEIFNEDNKLVDMYFTAIYLLIDTKSGEIKYSNAGHPAGISVDYNKNSVNFLEEGSHPIGLFPDYHAQIGTIEFNKGTRILLFTDGIFEFMNELDPYYATEKIGNMLLKNKEDEILENYVERIKKQDHIPDDVCFVSIQLK